MLTYDLEKRGSLARYDYLYRCIKEDILSGRLKAGEKLPSKRTLATHLNTAVVTVENAYAQLEAEGYLNAREKRGYFVNPVETGPVRENPAEAREKNREQREWRLDLADAKNTYGAGSRAASGDSPQRCLSSAAGNRPTSLPVPGHFRRTGADRGGGGDGVPV